MICQCFISLHLTLKTASMIDTLSDRLDNIQTILCNTDSGSIFAELLGIMVINSNQEWFWKHILLDLFDYVAHN